MSLFSFYGTKDVYWKSCDNPADILLYSVLSCTDSISSIATDWGSDVVVLKEIDSFWFPTIPAQHRFHAAVWLLEQLKADSFPVCVTAAQDQGNPTKRALHKYIDEGRSGRRHGMGLYTLKALHFFWSERFMKLAALTANSGISWLRERSRSTPSSGITSNLCNCSRALVENYSSASAKAVFAVHVKNMDGFKSLIPAGNRQW